MQFEDGIYDIPNDVYHSCAGYSRSRLMNLQKTIRHFEHSLESKDDATSDAMAIGNAVHLFVLEPHLAVTSIVVAPDFNKRTKDGRAAWEQFQEDNKGKIILFEDSYNKATTMASMLNERLDAEMEGYRYTAQCEKSIFFTIDGIQYKCRPDSFNQGIVIDIKTTRNASKRAFTRDAVDSGYLLQAAMIEKALDTICQQMIVYCLACVENTEPHATAMYMLDEDALDFGRKQFNALHEKLKTILEKEPEFRDYETDYLTLPAWANYVEME